MKDIHYDFNLSDTVSERLASSAQVINEKIIKPSDNDCTLLWYAWDSHAADIFVLKYRQFIGELSLVRDELIKQSEEIDRVSRIMHIKEEEAKRLASERRI